MPGTICPQTRIDRERRLQLQHDPKPLGPLNTFDYHSEGSPFSSASYRITWYARLSQPPTLGREHYTAKIHFVSNSQAKVGVQRLGYDMVFPLQYGVAGYATLQYGVALEVRVQAGTPVGNGALALSAFQLQLDTNFHFHAL